jgi:hypothetical protein
MNTVFNFKRTGLLVQRYFVERTQSELIFFGIMAFIFMLFRNVPVVIGVTLLIAGVFHAANVLKEIHAPAKGINYFMIPATQLEKITVSILLLVVYYFVMMFLAYVLGNLTGTALNNLLAKVDFFSSELELFYPSRLKWSLFENVSGMSTAVMQDGQVVLESPDFTFFDLFFELFLIIQSLFILGGIYFKRNQVFKTLAVLIIISFIFFIAGSLEAYWIFGRHTPRIENIETWFNWLKNTATVFYYLLIPYFWVTAYFRLTEKEV